VDLPRRRSPERRVTDEPLYPLGFEPIFQYRLWGGRCLGDWLDTPLPDGPIGEAWVLSDREDHASKVADGPLKGATITELMARSKTLMLGDLADRFDRFPLLLKFLDVSQMLSVQVHPRDDQADLIPKGETGKTEAWVVLQADAGSRIYAGLKPRTTAQDLRDLTTRTADDHLASFKPQIGQGVLIEAGTVHSLGDGVMVFEVQENSDVTFRLYDWDHIDAKTGKPRDLQFEQALACIDFDQGAISPVAPSLETAAPVRRERYFDNALFRLWRHEGAVPFTVGAAGEPRILVCADGGGHVEYAGGDYPMARGAVTLLPASVGACRFRPDGAVTLLEIAVAEPS
jgi:mannose-6-phosphate isomerase